MNVDVLWNDEKIFGWIYTKDLADPSQAGAVPSGLVQCNRVNIVRIKIDDPRRPRVLGFSPDDRLLGIAVKSMALRAGNR